MEFDDAWLLDRYRQLQQYVGWTEHDAAHIARLAPTVQPGYPALIEDFYAEIQKHQSPRSILLKAGPQVVDRLKKTLGVWLDQLFAGPYDLAYVTGRWRVGRRHVEIGLEQVYTSAALSRLRSGLTRTACRNWKGESAALEESLAAMNRLLDLDLAIIEDAYQAEQMLRERREAEFRLRGEKGFSESLLDAAQAVVVVLDKSGAVQRLNRFTEKLLGVETARVQGVDWFKHFTPEADHPRLKDWYHQVVEGSAIHGIAHPLLSRDGRKYLMEWSATPVRDGRGRIIGGLSIGLDVTETKRLEKELLQVSARERQWVGRDLHDGLGQELTGIAFLAGALARKLQKKCPGESADALELSKLVNQAIDHTRALVKGLCPVSSEPDGLMASLQEMAATVTRLYGLNCRLDCPRPVLIADNVLATHLYYIATEAVNNALKHSRAGEIVISLHTEGDRGTLSISDDGIGLPDSPQPASGRGLQIMQYRARMIGETLEISSGRKNGTTLRCLFDHAPSLPAEGMKP